ncbi:WD repeat-containing protein 53, partial [Lunasporangiospora selenospora]
DKTCRIWDVRSNKVHKALTGFDAPVASTCFTPADEHTIYVASGTNVYSYDLRMESLLINISQASNVYGGASDDIDQIHVNYRASYLVACDDAGDVRTLDLKTGKWMRATDRRHDNIAMTAQFIPAKDLQVISGGMDKRVITWDLYKGRALKMIETDIPTLPGVQAKQLFNPPFVHSIAIHPSGTHAAVGLGDGTVQFLHTAADIPTSEEPPAPSQDPPSTETLKKNKKKKSGAGGGSGSDDWVVGGRLTSAHRSGIATLQYAGFNPKWLVTSSGQGTVAIWDDHAARFACYQRLLQQQAYQQNVVQQLRKEGIPMAQATSAAAAVASANATPDDRPIQPVTEFNVTNMFERINCIATSHGTGGDAAEASTQKCIFVAGTHHQTLKAGSEKLQGRIAVYQIN